MIFWKAIPVLECSEKQAWLLRGDYDLVFSLALLSLWAASQTDLRRLSEPRFTVKPFQHIKHRRSLLFCCCCCESFPILNSFLSKLISRIKNKIKIQTWLQSCPGGFHCLLALISDRDRGLPGICWQIELQGSLEHAELERTPSIPPSLGVTVTSCLQRLSFISKIYPGCRFSGNF